MEETYLSHLRETITKQYSNTGLDCIGDFGQILCWEIHSNDMTFIYLASKWGISLPTLGELIKDHCDRLQDLPCVNHKFNIDLQFD